MKYCRYFKKGQCEHGWKGTLPARGKSICPLPHPVDLVCAPYLNHGKRVGPIGCPIMSCGRIHLILCKEALLSGKCSSAKLGGRCPKGYHPKGTKSSKPGSSAQTMEGSQRTKGPSKGPSKGSKQALRRPPADSPPARSLLPGLLGPHPLQGPLYTSPPPSAWSQGPPGAGFRQLQSQPQAQGFHLAPQSSPMGIPSGPQAFVPPEFSGQGQATSLTLRGQGPVPLPFQGSWDQGVTRDQLLSLLTRDQMLTLLAHRR